MDNTNVIPRKYRKQNTLVDAKRQPILSFTTYEDDQYTSFLQSEKLENIKLKTQQTPLSRGGTDSIGKNRLKT